MTTTVDDLVAALRLCVESGTLISRELARRVLTAWDVEHKGEVTE